MLLLEEHGEARLALYDFLSYLHHSRPNNGEGDDKGGAGAGAESRRMFIQCGRALILLGDHARAKEQLRRALQSSKAVDRKELSEVHRLMGEATQARPAQSRVLVCASFRS